MKEVNIILENIFLLGCWQVVGYLYEYMRIFLDLVIWLFIDNFVCIMCVFGLFIILELGIYRNEGFSFEKFFWN